LVETVIGNQLITNDRFPVITSHGHNEKARRALTKERAV